MKNINVKVKITSLDSEIEYQAIGEYKNSRIIFTDNEGDLNYIIIHNKTLEYYKRGSVDMKYKYDLNAVTKGFYSVVGNKFDFDIVTHNMTIDDECIYVKYDLYQSNELVNSTVLNVEYQVKEESQ